jgi:hypothetical protein
MGVSLSGSDNIAAKRRWRLGRIKQITPWYTFLKQALSATKLSYHGLI